MENSGRYDQRVVGFVDILGFGSLVQRADNDPQLRGEIAEGLRKVKSTPAPDPNDETDLRYQNFSDSLIISTRCTPNGFWHLLLSLDALAWNLLSLGMLVRGGVTIGNIHHDDHVVFGVAVNEAYRLESTVAKYPRIVIGRRALNAAQEFSNKNDIASNLQNGRLLRDADGVWFIHYLTKLVIFVRQKGSKDFTHHPLFAACQTISTIIQSKIDETLDSPDVYEKIRWLALYWNTEVVNSVHPSNRHLFQYVRLAGQEPRSHVLPFRPF